MTLNWLTLAEQAELRERQRAGLDATEAALDALVRAAPRTAELFAARRIAAESAARASRSAARAAREAGRARQARITWAGELTTHQATCAHQGLPAGIEALEGAAEAAGRARDGGRRLGRELGRLDDHVRRHQEQLQRVADAEALRDRAEQVADETWSRWHAEASALAAQHDAIDLSVAAGPGRADQGPESPGTGQPGPRVRRPGRSAS